MRRVLHITPLALLVPTQASLGCEHANRPFDPEGNCGAHEASTDANTALPARGSVQAGHAVKLPTEAATLVTDLGGEHSNLATPGCERRPWAVRGDHRSSNETNTRSPEPRGGRSSKARLGSFCLERAILVLLAFGLAETWAPARASAYRTFADDPTIAMPAAQRGEQVVVELASDGPPDDLGLFEHAITAAAASWSAAECSDLTLTYVGQVPMTAAPRDGHNTIELVYAGWRERGFPEGRGASTDVQLRSVGPNAEISEADIYVNLQDFTFGDADADGELDRQNVLTHELGHLLGLLHPCEHADPHVTECEGDTLAQESVLYPTYLGTRGRILSDDDRAGLCALYPAYGCPLSCGVGNRCETGNCVACGRLDCSPICPGPRCPDPSCGSADTCAEGTCSRYGENAHQCVAAGEPGASCTLGTDCSSGLCLTSRDAGFCTLQCASSDGCPADMQCTLVAQHEVCTPRGPPAGCSVGPTRTTSIAPLWLVATIVAAWKRQRRRI